ncbi:hypothetical protein [Georgenia sp. MJ170]|uniref:hypothetical protein n=1 Tax=Georgenia sunbinii TaxID=3117728 RepID=UPI002F26DB9A
MTTGVLVAVRGAAEAELVGHLDAAGTGTRVVRRCADVAEVLAAGLAGLGGVAVVSADHAGLDRTVVTRLAGAGVRTVLVAAAEDEPRCLGLGAAAVLDAAGDPAQWAAAVRDVAATVEHADGAPVVPSPGARPTPEVTEAGEPDAGAVPAAPATAPPGRLVVVWGPRGSPGRTSVAVDLVHELATTGPALLIDADTEAPSVAQVLGLLDETAGIAAAARLAGSGRLDATAFAGLCVTVADGVRLLTGLTRADRWRELPTAALDVVWERAREAAAWTVVDVAAGIEDAPGGFESAFAPRRHQATLAALAAADVVLVVGAGEPVGMHRLVLALQELADAGVTSATARRLVVVNRVRSSAAGAGAEQAVVESLARFAGVTDAVLVPDDRPAFDRAVLRGVTLAVAAPASPARDAVRELAARVADRPVARRTRRLARLGRAGRA